MKKSNNYNKNISIKEHENILSKKFKNAKSKTLKESCLTLNGYIQDKTFFKSELSETEFNYLITKKESIKLSELKEVILIFNLLEIDHILSRKGNKLYSPIYNIYYELSNNKFKDTININILKYFSITNKMMNHFSFYYKDTILLKRSNQYYIYKII